MRKHELTPAPATRDLLDVRGAAEFLGVSQNWIYMRVRAATIPHAKIGGILRFRRSVLERWIDEQAITTTKAA